MRKLILCMTLTGPRIFLDLVVLTNMRGMNGVWTRRSWCWVQDPSDVTVITWMHMQVMQQWIMDRYISKSYTTSKNTINRQYTERGQLWCQLLLVIFLYVFKHNTSPVIRSGNLSSLIILYRISTAFGLLNTDWIFDWITRLRAWLHTRITCVTHYCLNVSLPANKIRISFLADRSGNIVG